MSPDTTYSGPYARAVHIYRQAGWHGTLPLGSRPGVKFPPPSGWTGHGAPYPSAADVAAWSETHGNRNIGLRMPPGVIGLDVDDYGDKTGAATLAELEQRFGPLPPTWVSSARPAPSGIRFYRVPESRSWLNEQGSWSWSCPCGERSTANLPRHAAEAAVTQHEQHKREINWPGEAGRFIEIIQPGHRYAVVWPSANPEAAGAEYRWHRQGVGRRRMPEDVPRPDELPDLPVRWVEGLALPYATVDKTSLGSESAAAWWDGLR